MTKPSCHGYVFGYWEPGQWLAGLPLGFAGRPVWASQPDAPGRMRLTPIGSVCRNYRAAPPERRQALHAQSPNGPQWTDSR